MPCFLLCLECIAEFDFVFVPVPGRAEAEGRIQAEGGGIFPVAGQQNAIRLTKRHCPDVVEHGGKGGLAVSLSLLGAVDHHMPDVVDLFVAVVDDHDIADHAAARIDAKRRTLRAVDLRLRQTADRVRNKGVLPVTELQVECVDKIAFINLFQLNAVHVISP